MSLKSSWSLRKSPGSTETLRLGQRLLTFTPPPPLAHPATISLFGTVSPSALAVFTFGIIKGAA
jgi:hypothetical protein